MTPQLPWTPLNLDVMEAIAEAEEELWQHYPLPERPRWNVGDPITPDPESDAAFAVGNKAVMEAIDALFPHADEWELANANGGDPLVACAYDRIAIALWRSDPMKHAWLGELSHWGRADFVRAYHRDRVVPTIRRITREAARTA